MSAARISARDQRALRRGALVVLAAVLYIVGIKPSRERRAQLLEQLEVERGVLARERILAASRTDSNSAPGTQPSMQRFRGGDAVIASASLVEYLASEAEQQQVWLQQAVTSPPVRSGAASSRLEVTVRAESDLRGLLGWLAALERGPMLSQIHSLDVRAIANDSDDGRSPLAISAVVRSASVRSTASRDSGAR